MPLQLSQPQTAIKASFMAVVTHMYGFQPGAKLVANKKLSADLLHEHWFMYKEPGKVETIFQHDLVGYGIYATFFKGKAIGMRNCALFNPMPTTLIAFVCCIL
ncbi:hypothetical protein FRC08_008983 [Ceratobasidium sp. 394]|nr:hypothetical protein FRC08_008983 [Ceratobasidium sp. 394]